MEIHSTSLLSINLHKAILKIYDINQVAIF